MTPLALSLPAPPAHLTVQCPPITSQPAAALAPTGLAVDPGTATDGRAGLQQMLVNVYGGAAVTLLALADWEEHVWVQVPFEELPVHPARANAPRLPGLRALGLEVLFEVGQMDFFTWRVRLFGSRYARAEVVEASESVGGMKDGESGGARVREEEDESEDAFAGGRDVTGKGIPW